MRCVNTKECCNCFEGNDIESVAIFILIDLYMCQRGDYFADQQASRRRGTSDHTLTGLRVSSMGSAEVSRGESRERERARETHTKIVHGCN